MSLIRYFPRIAIISLPHCSDRRERLAANLRERGLAQASDLTWFEAVDGNAEPLPPWWKQGPGAWGCRASQLAVLRAAQRDGLESVLILEDDAHFHHRAAEWLSMLMPLLPDDWDFLYLGGQHMTAPTATGDPRLLRGTCITRTHAYAVHRRAFASVIAQVSDLSLYEANPSWHIDHQFALGQRDRSWKAFAPAWWLAAQDAGESNIARQSFPRRWWVPGNHYWQLPFVSKSSGATGAEWVFRPEIEEDAIPPDRFSRAVWLRDIAREAWLQGRLPSVPLDASEIARLWPGGCRTPRDSDELAWLADYPANSLFPHPFASAPDPQPQPQTTS